MRSLLSLNNGRASIALKNIPLLKKIITRYPTILTYLDYTNPASTQNFFNFLLTNPKYLGCIGYLNPESELTLFQKPTNIDSLINANPYYNVFYRSSAPVINLFLQEKALGTLLYAYSLPELSNLFQKDIYLPNYLITSPQLQNIYLKENDIKRFIKGIENVKVGTKTTNTTLTCLTGFEVHGQAACVKPENFDLNVGANYAQIKAEDKIWEGLGFVLQWAKYGLKR
jgi:hypothetical protein